MEPQYPIPDDSTGASRRCSEVQEALADELADRRQVRRAELCLVPLEQGRERAEQLPDAEVAVAGTEEGGLHGVRGPRAPEPALLAQHDRLGVLGTRSAH